MTTVFVPGTPVPQGSAKIVHRGTRPVITADNPRTRPWRADIHAAVIAATGDRIEYPAGPVAVTLGFVMPRRVAEPKRSTPPHVRKPDLDKLVRAALDALTGLAFTDDNQVVEIHTYKRTAEIGERPGAEIGWEPA